MAGDALKSHLDLLLLASVRDGPKHGYAIVDFLRQASGGRFDLPEGTIYPALHRLEQLGLLESVWTEALLRRRRVYALTPAGITALGERQHNWQAFLAGMAGVLGT
jgi:PadR family transcriptional regulator PadR